MASSISVTDINASFPVAGQDNSSQGFHTNFATIKTALSTAKTEITALQATAPKLDASNNYGGNQQIDQHLFRATASVFNGSTIAANYVVSFLDGHYQKFQISNNVTLEFGNWPISGRYSTLRLELVSSSATDQNVQFSAGSTRTLYKDLNFPTTFTVSNTYKQVIEFWTTDGGQTVYAKHVGRFA